MLKHSALLLILVLSIAAMGQPSSPAQVACKKTITFAIAAGGQPVPAIPKFAVKWIGNGKNVQGYPGLCLSQTPSSDSLNYIIVFSNTETVFSGLVPAVHTYTSTGPLSSNVAGVSGYGGTWTYSYTGRLPDKSTNTIDLELVDNASKSLVLRAYNQQGHEVAHYGLAGSLTREKLLGNVIADIQRDQAATPSTKKMAAPMSVYYVNCDVDSSAPASSAVASLAPNGPAAPVIQAPAAAPAAKLHPVVDFASNPPGADIYLDGTYIGKTPFTIGVEPGPHRLVIAKQNFSTWQQKLDVSAAGRKVSAYLEQKFLMLK